MKTLRLVLSALLFFPPFTHPPSSLTLDPSSARALLSPQDTQPPPRLAAGYHACPFPCQAPAVSSQRVTDWGCELQITPVPDQAPCQKDSCPVRETPSLLHTRTHTHTSHAHQQDASSDHCFLHPHKDPSPITPGFQMPHSASDEESKDPRKNLITRKVCKEEGGWREGYSLLLKVSYHYLVLEFWHV